MGISRLTDIHSYSSFWKLLVKASVSLLMSGPLPHSLLYKCVYKASGLPGKVENKSLITNKKNKTWSATSSFQGTRVFTYISCMPGCQEKTQIVVFNFLGYHTKTWVSLWYFSTYNHHPLVLFIPSTPTSLPGSFSFLPFSLKSPPSLWWPPSYFHGLHIHVNAHTYINVRENVVFVFLILVYFAQHNASSNHFPVNVWLHLLS